MASHYLGEPHGIEMQEIIELDHLAFFAEGTKAEVYRVQGHRGALAVKILKQSSEDYEIDRRDFERETDVLRRLVHRNIVNVYAYGSFPRPFAIIEFLDEGTLTQARKHAAKRVGTADLIRRRVFTYVDVLKVRGDRLNENAVTSSSQAALDVASALDYIHERLPNDMLVIHRDLKVSFSPVPTESNRQRFATLLQPDNVGFDGDGTAKLFDFGLCACIKKRKLQSEVYTLTGCTGSMRYSTLSTSFNAQCDVFVRQWHLRLQ
jgi:serine/threonine protein kinase